MAVAIASDASAWRGRLQLGFSHREGRTCLSERRREGPLAVQRPFYPEGGICHVYLLHPPGGVVGGDWLELDVTAGAHGQVLLTTPGATKFYRSAAPQAVQDQRLRIEQGAGLEWLPQENIYFPGARVRLNTRVELAGDARFALWESHSLGRPVNHEAFDEGELDLRLQVWHDGRPLLLERLRVTPQRRGDSAGLAGHPVVATQLFFPADREALAIAREEIGSGEESLTSATLVDGLLVVRYLGNSTEKARILFTSIWSRLREPLLGRRPVPPRIWAT